MKYDIVVISQFTNEKHIHNLIDSLKKNKKVSIYFILINQTGQSIKPEMENDRVQLEEIVLNEIVSGTNIGFRLKTGIKSQRLRAKSKTR